MGNYREKINKLALEMSKKRKKIKKLDSYFKNSIENNENDDNTLSKNVNIKKFGNKTKKGKYMPKLTISDLETFLWKSADILRGSIDSAEYKHFIFGFLSLLISL